MNVTIWLMIVLLFLPAVKSNAEIKPLNTPPTNIEIQYALSNLQFLNGSTEDFKIDRQSSLGNIESGAPAIDPATFKTIYNSINDALRLDDLKRVLSEAYFQILKEKVKSGASQYIVLAMIQVMRPNELKIVDFAVSNGQAIFAVSGISKIGFVRGQLYLIYQDNTWRIDREQWIAGERTKGDPIFVPMKIATGSKKYADRGSTGVLAQVSPDYVVKNGFLKLTHVPNTVRKQSFMFVFLMNKNVSDHEEIEESFIDNKALLKKPLPKEHHRNRMHLLWTGPKKLLPAQRLIKNQYPVDVSVAQYDDGFSKEEVNLILPNKKPREVSLSLLWSF